MHQPVGPAAQPNLCIHPPFQNETDDIYKLADALGIPMPSTESSAVSYVVSPMARAQLEIQAVIASNGLAAVLSNSSARTHGRLRAGFQIQNFNETASTEGLTSWSRRLLSTPCSSANSILVSWQLPKHLTMMQLWDACGSDCQTLHEGAPPHGLLGNVLGAEAPVLPHMSPACKSPCHCMLASPSHLWHVCWLLLSRGTSCTGHVCCLQTSIIGAKSGVTHLASPAVQSTPITAPTLPSAALPKRYIGE